jgi:phosphotriesterase-related protein
MAAGCCSFLDFSIPKANTILTVGGPIDASKMGVTLAHEHILVDFIGAENYDPTRWNRAEVVEAVLPELIRIKQLGVETLFEFTPAFLGRDVELLKELSTKSGLNIITNTGFYGAVNNKYLPAVAFKASADELARVWIDEFEKGIEGTGIKPGFIKISVNPETLSDLHKKLVQAAAITHLRTGLTIASHTGPGIPALEQIEVLNQSGVNPAAFVWVHAQNEENTDYYLQAASTNAWVSLDGVQQSNIANYLQLLHFMKEQGLLGKVLVSQDAGWYEPGKPWNGPSRSYTDIHHYLIPELKKSGFTKKNIKQIFELNPAEAFAVRIRNL